MQFLARNLLRSQRPATRGNVVVRLRFEPTKTDCEDSHSDTERPTYRCRYEVPDLLFFGFGSVTVRRVWGLFEDLLVCFVEPTRRAGVGMLVG